MRDIQLPFRLIHPTRSYVDTIILWLPGPLLPRGVILAVQAVNAGSVWPKEVFKWHSKWGRRLWGHRIIVQQPSYKALLVLEDYQRRYEGTINRLDMACDLFPDVDEFTHCRNCLRDQLLVWYRHAGPMYPQENTISWVNYEGGRVPSRNITLYLDFQPSKLNNRVCVHFDAKLSRSRTLERLDIRTISDVIKINPAELLPEVIRLVELGSELRSRELPGQLIYDDRKLRKLLRPMSLDGLGLACELEFVKQRNIKAAA
jgi:hypothetical protein